MVTMQQIADRCGVSRGTVDRALHHKEGVREEVAERIRATAREMGYISNRLVMQQTQQWKIGVVLHSGHSPFVQMLCELFESFPSVSFSQISRSSCARCRTWMCSIS